MDTPTHTSSLRAIRTYADDVRRVKEEKSEGGSTPRPQTVVSRAISDVAPNYTAPPTRVIAQKGVEDAVPAMKPISAEAGDTARNIHVDHTLNRSTRDATIITDKKTSRWSFSDAVYESLHTWWHGKTSSEPTAKPLVASPLSRADVIKAAGANSSIAEHGSHDALVTKIRETHTSTAPEVAIRPVAPERAPSWSGEGRVREEPVPKNARPQVFVTNEPPRALDPSTKDAPIVDIPLVVEKSTKKNESSWNASRDAYTESLPGSALPVIEKPKEKTRLATVLRERAKSQPRAEVSAPTPRAHSFLIYGCTALGVLSLVGGIGYGVYLFTQNGTGETEIVNVSLPQSTLADPILPNTTRQALPFPNSRRTLLSELRTRRDVGGEYGSMVEYFFAYPDDPNRTLILAPAFFSVLEPRAPGSLLRNIDPVFTLGISHETTSSPYLIFRTHDRTEAQGGMLSWEPYLQSDLAPFFGDDLFVSEGATESELVYLDDTIGGTDVRILYNREGAPSIIYGFPKPGIIVITTDVTTFAKIVEKIRE